jgi:hypothetical protein
MKKEIKCENCKWCYGIHLFECRRFPPQFPSIELTYFCGEFKKSLNPNSIIQKRI